MKEKEPNKKEPSSKGQKIDKLDTGFEDGGGT